MSFSYFGGMLIPVAFTSIVPSGHLTAEGGNVSRVTYADLFAMYGTMWGAGDGVTTFGLPDMGGAQPVGAGSGIGLTPRTLGSVIGELSHTLTISEMPSHQHKIATGNTADSDDPTSRLFGDPGAGNVYSAVSDGSNMDITAVGATGLAVPHSNMAPYASIRWLIPFVDVDPEYEIGELRFWPSSTLPASSSGNWIFANGAAYSPTGTMAALFGVIGYRFTYGATGGLFNVPDIQGRLVRCAGSGTGLSGCLLGATGGFETTTLDETTIPAHTHKLLSFAGRRERGSASSPSNNVIAKELSGYDFFSDPPGPSGNFMGLDALRAEGGGLPHNNMPPGVVVNVIIAIA